MKKSMLCGLLLLILCMLAGCEAQIQQQSPKKAYQIYRLNSGKTKLVEEGVDLTAEKTEEMIEEMIGKIMEKPAADMQTVLPEGVQIVGATIQNTNLLIEFNQAYYQMNNVEEALCRAAVVKTLVQIPGVDAVAFSIEGNELVDAEGNALGYMNADVFIDSNGEGINPYQYAAITLYFPDASGQKLVREMRNVHYSSNNTLEKVIVEELLKGPLNTKLQPLADKDAKILSVTTLDGVCTINFDAAFNRKMADSSNVSAQVIIYSVVDAVCDSADIQQVQIQIEGDSNLKFQDEVELSQPFLRNKNIISQPDGKEETETELENPSIGVDKVAPGK